MARSGRGSVDHRGRLLGFEPIPVLIAKFSNGNLDSGRNQLSEHSRRDQLRRVECHHSHSLVPVAEVTELHCGQLPVQRHLRGSTLPLRLTQRDGNLCSLRAGDFFGYSDSDDTERESEGELYLGRDLQRPISSKSNQCHALQRGCANELVRQFFPLLPSHNDEVASYHLGLSSFAARLDQRPDLPRR